MIGDHTRSNPAMEWDFHFMEDLSARAHSPRSASYCADKALAALQRYLPSNQDDVIPGADGESDDFDVPVDAFSCDDFRMFEFKVKKCVRARSHDWTECPFAHPGEKARRRDPRKFHYSGNACPDFRKGVCKRGDACEYAHGVFECWLHPGRYRTQPCKEGTQCRRRVCFFAHTPDQLRVLPYSIPEVCDPQVYPAYGSFAGSHSKSTMYSPPLSPKTASPPISPSLSSLNQLGDSIRCLQLNSNSPPSWGFQMGAGFSSPRSPSTLGGGYKSLPLTPVGVQIRPGRSIFGKWEAASFGEEEPMMERVESGKELRERIYAKLSQDNSLERGDSTAGVPDVGWISELVK